MSSSSSFSSLLLCLLTLSNLATSMSLSITIPASLPNLPPTTQATLTTLPSTRNEVTKQHILTVPLTRSASFVFPDLPSSPSPESYLLDIRAAGEYTFAPYRVDVSADGSILGIWETFRGNAWENRGAEKFVSDGAAGSKGDVLVEAKVLGRKSFYEERETCEYPRIFFFWEWVENGAN